MPIFPTQFIERSKSLLGNEWSEFLLSLESNSPVSIRLNDKIALDYTTTPVPWCNSGYYLPKRPFFTADPLFHAGAYYVQEASSMFLQQALEQYVSSDSIVLDLCAAPGGKSTLISQYLSENGFLVSNEIIKSRAHILAENLIKWGNANFMVCNNQPKDFEQYPAIFDTIIIDAPCSGEGMFRKDPDSINEWSYKNVLMCSARQKKIVEDIWDSLKTNGILIYSTCTYNREENEENIAWIAREMGAEILSLNTEQWPEITRTENGYKFFPHKTVGEGFFLSILRKTSASPACKKVKHKNSKEKKQLIKIDTNIIGSLSDWDNWDIRTQNEFIIATQKKFSGLTEILSEKLQVIHKGIILAEIKGKSLIPHISLAMSKNINRSMFYIVDVDLTTALSYLCKEAISLPAAPISFILLSYKTIPIGLVKNIGNRCNNLYPSEWKIRSRLSDVLLKISNSTEI